MRKTTTILSMLLLGTTLMASQVSPDCKSECDTLKMADITFVEEEEKIDLGFDTAQYLPEGFDPYEGMEPNLNDIVFVEESEEIDLGFDTAQYLPEGFNAYKGMVFDIDDIEYIEEEEEINLDFDIQAYLPEGFEVLSK